MSAFCCQELVEYAVMCDHPECRRFAVAVEDYLPPFRLATFENDSPALQLPQEGGTRDILLRGHARKGKKRAPSRMRRDANCMRRRNVPYRKTPKHDQRRRRSQREPSRLELGNQELLAGDLHEHDCDGVYCSCGGDDNNWSDMLDDFLCFDPFDLSDDDDDFRWDAYLDYCRLY